MKLLIKLFSTIAIIVCVSHAQARDDVKEYSVADALATEKAKSVLGNQVKFYFGKQAHGTVAKRFGEFGTNKKTNGVGKSDREACEWAFYSALLSLKQRAEREGGNAVINIRSNYRGNTTSSNDTFRCGSGAIMSGVALLGDVVTLN